MPKGTFLAVPHPCGEPLLTHISIRGPQTPAGRFGSVSCGVTAPFLWCEQGFICALQDWSLCFPQSYGSPIIKSCWPSGQIPWGFLVPLWDPQVGSSSVGFRTLIILGELLWYYCTPVCRSSTWQVWTLILSWLCPFCNLATASSLSLDVGYLFLVGSSILLSRVFQKLVAVLGLLK